MSPPVVARATSRVVRSHNPVMGGYNAEVQRLIDEARAASESSEYKTFSNSLVNYSTAPLGAKKFMGTSLTGAA